MSVQVQLLNTDNWFQALLMVIISILFSIIAIGVFIFILTFFGFEINIEELVNAAIIDVLTDRQKFFRIIFWATPLMLTGLAVAIAFHAGLFNIGGQGQLIVGGAFAAIWAANLAPTTIFPFSFKPFMVLTTLVVGFLGGAIWGFIPGYLKARTGAHEVIVTIMMNLIALSFVTYLVGSQSYSPFVDSTSVDAYSQTNVIAESAKIKAIFPSISSSLTWATPIVILVVIFMHLLIYQSRYGFKIRAVGFNDTAAETAGIDTKKTIIGAMTISGGLAGLAGSILVMGQRPYRYIIGLERALGFDGIAVALIAQNSPIAIIFAALIFGLLQEGKISLDTSTSIPPDIIFALQALVIIFMAAPLLSKWVYDQLNVFDQDDAVDVYLNQQGDPPSSDNLQQKEGSK